MDITVVENFEVIGLYFKNYSKKTTNNFVKIECAVNLPFFRSFSLFLPIGICKKKNIYLLSIYFIGFSIIAQQNKKCIHRLATDYCSLLPVGMTNQIITLHVFQQKLDNTENKLQYFI